DPAGGGGGGAGMGPRRQRRCGGRVGHAGRSRGAALRDPPCPRGGCTQQSSRLTCGELLTGCRCTAASIAPLALLQVLYLQLLGDWHAVCFGRGRSPLTLT